MSGLESRIRTLDEVARLRAETDPARVAYLFLPDGESEDGRLTYGELDRRARALAARLQAATAAGDRVLLLLPPGLDYVVAFFACLYSGVVAVPAYPPRANGHGLDRLAAIVRDAGAVAALAPASVREAALGRPDGPPELRALSWLAPDEADAADADGWRPPGRDRSRLAFLQYTSGSTGDPKGVMIGHASLMANLAVIRDAFENRPETVGVSWLPPYHDMGLVGGLLQPLFVGFLAVLMPPAAFLQRPIRWLRAISRRRATVSGAPNFAYDLCVARTTPEERADLDLGSWRVAFNGAEPVREATLDRFVETFGRHGFRRETFYPCYGLAETTLLATGGAAGAAPEILRVGAAGLEVGRVAPVDSSGRERALVGCGRVLPGHEVALVDPATGRASRPDALGEIWLAGPSVAEGYWGRPNESRETFGARQADGRGPFLRTGDLGLVSEGELYVVGRAKDLVIVHGRNHHPADLEETAAASHPSLRLGGTAAFAVETGDGEGLVIVQEVDRRALRRLDADAAIAAIRAAVWERHEVAPRTVALVRPGGVPLTSSGKVRRSACREALLADLLPVISSWTVAAAPRPGPPPPGERADTALTVIEADLRDHVAGLLGLPVDLVDPTEPLSSYGVTSLQVVEFHTHVADRFGVDLDLDLFAEDPSVRRLADHIRGRGATRPRRLDLAAEVRLDPAIAAGTSVAGARPLPPGQGHPSSVLLTGATGFLGAYLLRELLAEPTTRVHCLVRATGEAVARERIERNLAAYGLWDPAWRSRIVPVIGDLAQPRLGLEQPRFDALAAEVEVVYHNAAWLNFVYAYPLLRAANVGGTQEALRLAARGRPKPFHYVSTTGVFDSLGYARQSVDELTPLDKPDGMVLGYSQSKWVAERIVALAGQRGLPTAIYRPSWIFGDAETGSCNADDFISRLLDACAQLGLAPELDYVWNIVPVDYVSRAIVHLAGRADSIGQTFHLSSTRPVHWSEMVEWLRASYPVRVVEYAEWRARLLDREGRRPTALDPLVPLFQNEGQGGLTIPQVYQRSSMPTIDGRRTSARLEGRVACRSLDTALFAAHLTALERAGLFVGAGQGLVGARSSGSQSQVAGVRPR